MVPDEQIERLHTNFVVKNNHSGSDYFSLIRELLKIRESDPSAQSAIDQIYRLIEDEIVTNQGVPVNEINFGTSGWRGILGKDVFLKSVRCVTEAIVDLYRMADTESDLHQFLGVSSLEEARERGCLVGWDNRFGGEVLGQCVTDTLREHGFKVYYCGETTTGVLSAALLELQAAFSVNLTPSHNPLDYGGYKFNAADGGPAASELTAIITQKSRARINAQSEVEEGHTKLRGALVETDSFALWQRLVDKNKGTHRLDYRSLLDQVGAHRDMDIVIDSVHGASRLHIKRLLGPAAIKLEHLRGESDVTFGGIAPEPSSENMSRVTQRLRDSRKKLKIGAIIDPDADRIRFTDGDMEISMNQFGAMSYHYLHEYKNLTGMVAKTVATSNLANSVAVTLGEELFETKVGFKEFKPVIGQALVYFEESDGISVIGHTPEKDAYIGLLLALDMVVSTGKNLGEIKAEMDELYGEFYPDRDGVAVSLKGEPLLAALAKLKKYDVGTSVTIGGKKKIIKEIITKDGRKMIFEDDSWLMVRPSGTEPKVRFYVESRDSDGTAHLVDAARSMLAEVGLLD
ncbi:MAG: phosphoglucomutase [Desulfobulbaceae bacterium]|nr:MAG: phosphoglucomutase [Desulfobulbaceae bacterium]